MKAIISKRIISIINAIFFTLLIIFVVTIVSLLLWLKQGIYYDHVTLLDHKISRLYIKWDKKITVQAQSIEKLTYSSNKALKIPNLDWILRVAYNALEKIEIDDIKMDNFQGSIQYYDQQLLVKSNVFDLKTQYSITPTQITTESFKMHVHDINLTLEGNASIDKESRALYLDSKFLLANDLKGNIKLKYQDDILYLDGTTVPFKSIGFVQQFLNIPPKTADWIFNKLSADDFVIEKLTSHFSFNNPKQFLENLDVKAHLTNFAYTFSRNLHPITADEAYINFKYGTLEILPLKPFYNQKNIDGTKVTLLYLLTKPAISIILRTKEQLDEEIVDILRNYKVPFPLLQKSGQSDMATNLLISLVDGTIQYDALVKLNKSELLIGGANFYVDKSSIQIKDHLLTISDTVLDDAKSIQGTLAGQMDLAKMIGSFDANITSWNLGLVKTKSPLPIQLVFDINGISLKTRDSRWSILDTYDFSLLNREYLFTKDLKLIIPSTHFYDPKRLDISINGFIDFKSRDFDLNLLVNNIIFGVDDQNKTMHLLHPVEFKSNPKKQGSFENNRPIIVSNGDNNISINKVTFSSAKDIIFNVKDIRYKHYLKSDIYAFYNPKKHKGYFDFNDISVDLNSTDPAYVQFHTPKISFSIDAADGLRIYSEQLKSGYKKQAHEHILHIDDVSKIAFLSPFLKSIHQKKGKVLVKTEDFQNFSLFSKLQDFKIDGFINENLDNSVDIVGSLNKRGFTASINDKLHVSIFKDINISMNQTGFDLQPLMKESNTSQSTSFSKALNFEGTNGFLIFGKNNQLIFDNFQAQALKKAFYATLTHADGKAILFSEKKKIELFGENFNDFFLQNLIGFNGFKGGKYSFYIKGDSAFMTGGISIQDATAKDFALYNNILAYFNTIPALFTFNSPGFNSEGFTIQKGEIGFEKTADLVTIKTLKLFGRSSNVFGSGTIDLSTNKVDLTMRVFLLKDMGTILSNIPIAGYLLLGEDGSLTTTITITGDLKKPSIGVNLAKDIFMAPVNILKRTFSLPSRLLHWLTGDTK